MIEKFWKKDDEKKEIECFMPVLVRNMRKIIDRKFEAYAEEGRVLIFFFAEKNDEEGYTEPEDEEEYDFIENFMYEHFSELGNKYEEVENFEHEDTSEIGIYFDFDYNTYMEGDQPDNTHEINQISDELYEDLMKYIRGETNQRPNYHQDTSVIIVGGL